MQCIKGPCSGGVLGGHLQTFTNSTDGIRGSFAYLRYVFGDLFTKVTQSEHGIKVTHTNYLHNSIASIRGHLACQKCVLENLLQTLHTQNMVLGGPLPIIYKLYIWY